MATQVDGDRGSVVTRQFEDIEWLHHQLVTKNSTAGIIVGLLLITLYLENSLFSYY